ncbi:hypothetical protein DERP_012205 [Dermatophagoides pteronyssinus]|uniref:Uncharacterized protein n=1 Tax=Dermatophagoides pteronyssinus TaxID=6956 RepID=A0ABQ8JGC7_DERPT|nr:hypothetical protein DERP_012205 [Dermatophagoides pteronyssinus]
MEMVVMVDEMCIKSNQILLLNFRKNPNVMDGIFWDQLTNFHFISFSFSNIKLNKAIVLSLLLLMIVEKMKLPTRILGLGCLYKNFSSS